jgi:hypothetical protein
MYLSTNNGNSWNSLISMFSSTLGNSPTVLSIVIDGTNIYATSGVGVFLSTDNGITWNAVNTGLPSGPDAIALSGSNLFAGTWGNGVYYSSNNGGNWTAVNTGLTNMYINTIAVSGSNIFAGTENGGVFLSTNNGSTWTAVNTGLSISNSIKSFAISGSNVFTGTDDGGVYLFSNSGNNWIAVNTGLTITNIYSLAASGDTLFAGSYKGGVWKRSITDILTSNCSAQFIMTPDTTILHHYYAINYSTGATPLNYLWSWGDGTFDTTAYPSHVYGTAGLYNICLTISNSVGCSSTFCDSTYLQKSTNTVISVDVIPSGATGLNEIELTDQLKIFPNPANNEIFINYSAGENSVEFVKVTDILGQQNYYSDKAIKSINTSFLKEGVYFIEVKNKNEQSVISKFIISR